MGCGTYATNSMRVALDHATVNTAGHKYVFMCDALIGTFCEGTPGHLEPPIRHQRTLRRFDSTVNNQDNPTKYAVYSDYSILVRYLIKFQKKARPEPAIFKLLS